MVNMNIRVTGGGPLISKNMNIVPGLSQLVNIALHKLLCTTIKDKFLPNDSYFHYEVKPKGLRVRLVQDIHIYSNCLIHHIISTQFFFTEGIRFFDPDFG